MTTPISDLRTLLSSLSPRRDARDVAYVHLADSLDALSRVPSDALIGFFRETEGQTLIVELGTAERLGLPVLLRAAWITLDVRSDLAAVGLTAAFATALGEAGISCNVVAAACHDHVFVPLDDADRALDALNRLQSRAGAASP